MAVAYYKCRKVDGKKPSTLSFYMQVKSNVSKWQQKILSLPSVAKCKTPKEKLAQMYKLRKDGKLHPWILLFPGKKTLLTKKTVQKATTFDDGVVLPGVH